MALPSPTPSEREMIIKELCHSSSHTASYVHFDTFMRFYTSTLLGRGNVFSVAIQEPVFRTHLDVINAVRLLRGSATLSKSSFQNQAFRNSGEHEQEYSVRIAVKVAFMVDCSSKDDFSGNYQIHHPFPVKWTAAQNFIEFLRGAFPTTTSRPFHTGPSNGSLKAWKLRRRYKIRFIPTNDLVQHLIYDRQASTVKIFHQTAFLKAQLAHTSNLSLDAGFDDSVLNGSLPPQLLLETLLTLYYILFPISIDRKSRKLTQSLVRKRKLDPNLMIDDGSIRIFPSNFAYIYWGERLRILEGITVKPPPGNKIVSWMERHTSERNAYTVAVFGIFLTALFGFLSFIVGVAQLVVSILAWKYPSASTV